MLSSGWPLVPILFVTVPMIAIAIDMLQGSVRPNLHNLLVGYGFYSFRIYFLLGAQFIIIPLLFALYPAGFFLQLLGLIDIVIHLLGQAIDPIPFLCGWTGLRPPYCGPGLAVFHIGHLLLASLVATRVSGWMDSMRRWYNLGLETLAARFR